MQAKAKVRGPFGLELSHTVVFVLATGLVLSGAVAWLAHATIHRDEEQRFEMARQEVDDLVRARFDRVLGILNHTRAFLTTKDRVSRQDFRVFVQSVDLPHASPDVLAVTYVDRVASVHRSAHERDVREDGYPGYRVWPRRKGAYRVYPIKFVEPFEDANRRVLGYDVYSDEKRAAALDRARDSGLPALTDPVALLQDNGLREGPAFLLAIPVYQRGLRVKTKQERRWALRGYVTAAFRAADFFKEVVRSAAVFHQGIALRAWDGSEPLFDSKANSGHLHAVTNLALYGQTWAIEVIATPGFASPADRYAALVLLFTGLLITILVAWGVYLAGRHAESQLEAIELRDEFLSICSHELRTPLTSMKLQNQLVQRTIREDIANGNTARFEKMVQQSGRQIERLVRLVEDMLDISRIRSGKLALAPEELDFCQVVQDTLERFTPQLQAAGCPVRLSLPDELPGRWDRMRLEQIFVNLLSNAIKYGPGKPIEVELLRLGDKAVLSVQDQGIGIAAENQARIFERFERASSKADIGGLGLGLYIVKQILEVLGGSIRVESAPGEGSRFVVELPVDPVGLPAAGPLQDEEAEAALARA